MATHFRPPKQWLLTETETITSFSNWQSNMIYNLSLCDEFAPYLDTEWSKQGIVNRGLADDAAGAPNGKTAVQKVIMLERMLGLVAQFAPSLLRNEIIKRSTSLAFIWQRIRRHYGFTQSEVNFLTLSEIHRTEGERVETFYQRIVAHLEDNLLTISSGLQHDGAIATNDETMSPTTERLAVFIWLSRIDQRLPSYVARVYAHELESKTLKDLQPLLSQAMDSLLAQLSVQDDIQIQYARSSYKKRNGHIEPYKRRNGRISDKPKTSTVKHCSICKSAGRTFEGHDVSSCWFLSKFEKMEIAKTLRITVDDSDIEDENIEENPTSDIKQLSGEFHQAIPPIKSILQSPDNMQVSDIKQVECDISPFFYAFLNHHPVHVVIDSGATSSVVSRSFLQAVGIKPKSTLHSARSADKSKLDVTGEIHITLSFGGKKLSLMALVMDKLDCDVLAGIPFCKRNDIHIHMKSEAITIGDITVPYGSKPQQSSNVYRIESCVLRNDSTKVLMPGEYVEIYDKELDDFNGEIAIEPRVDSPLSGSWPAPTISRVIQGTVRIPNLNDEPIKLIKSQHIAQIRRVQTPSTSSSNSELDNELQDTSIYDKKAQQIVDFTSKISVDPDNILSKQQRQDFISLNKSFNSVFTTDFGAYNDSSGLIRAHVNIGSIEPPPLKGKLPLYSRNNLKLLQEEADKLEALGILAKPETVGVNVKYVSPSFLVKKPNGEHRFVTAFNNLSPYVRILPTATVSCDDVLRRLSSFNFLIKADLTKSFFQIRVDKSSMPYLATVTPFKGIRVYTRAAMGMPGSSEYLQEVTSRVFGDYVQEGFLVVIADDMFIGGNTIDSLIHNWSRVLHRLRENNLTLSPSKTVICPKRTIILGWNWSSGTLSPNSHRIASLSSVAPPKTCTSMRSFIGGFKAISRCIPHYASLLSPLEDAIKQLQGSQAVTWTPELSNDFEKAQAALRSPKTITIPKPTDQLVLTMDASPVNNGLGATLFAQRGDKRYISGFYSLQNWFPCELEALAIAASVNHFAPYIRESTNPTQVLTDSKPCVQAYQRLCRGQFSASARISTFLSTLSSHHVTLQHLPGKFNSSSDYSSRHPQTCADESCQICKFVNDTIASVVNQITVKDVISGATQMPFLNSSAWKSAQHDCPNLRRAFAHLTQGTRPSRKVKNQRSLRRYLKVATINDQGLIVVRKSDPFVGIRSLIVVPDDILHGILTAIHLRFDHATKPQLTQLFNRHFFAIKSEAAVKHVVDNCEQCTAMKVVPKEIFEQKITQTPSKPGELFFSDVLCRSKQKILVTREVHSSFTTAMIILDEKADSLREGLLINTAHIKAPNSTIRLDTAPGLLALKNDSFLANHGIVLDFGLIKNINANSVVDKAIQELEQELLRSDPLGSPVTALQLQLALASLNSRIRNRGLSAREILFQRDQYTNEQITLDDHLLAQQQRGLRESNHTPSAVAKAPGKAHAKPATVKAGDLVFIKQEANKNKVRDRYIVVKIKQDQAFLQKLGNKFMSRQYQVPLTNIYAASPNYQQREQQRVDSHNNIPSSSDSDSDCENITYDDPSTNNINNRTLISDESEDFEPEITPDEHSFEDNVRPKRNRQPPAWARSGTYEM